MVEAGRARQPSTCGGSASASKNCEHRSNADTIALSIASDCLNSMSYPHPAADCERLTKPSHDTFSVSSKVPNRPRCPNSENDINARSSDELPAWALGKWMLHLATEDMAFHEEVNGPDGEVSVIKD